MPERLNDYPYYQDPDEVSIAQEAVHRECPWQSKDVESGAFPSFAFPCSFGIRLVSTGGLSRDFQKSDISLLRAGAVPDTRGEGGQLCGYDRCPYVSVSQKVMESTFLPDAREPAL